MNMDTVMAALPGEIGYDEALGPIWPEAKKFYHESMGVVFKLLKDQTFDTIKKDKNSTSEVLKPLNDLHEKIVEELWTHCCSNQNQFSMIEDTKRKLSSALKFQLRKYTEELVLLVNSSVRPVIGIDLGTTFCCVAVYHEGKVNIVPNAVGQNTTPSYVGFDEGYTFVGQPAKDQANLTPQRIIFDAKRLIGRKFDEGIVQDDIKQWPFEVVADDQNNPMIKVEGETYYPEAISAKLLASLREDAEAYIGGIPIADAVITVPAYFNNAQRDATKEAGKLAGLNVLQILNEPTAVVIAYNLHRSKSTRKNVLVFDLGDCTLDVSVLKIENRSIKILAVGGDTHIGGGDLIDSAMVDYCIEQFKKKHGVDLYKVYRESDDDNVKFKVCLILQRLRNYCKQVNTQLSLTPSASSSVELLHGDKSLNVLMTRKILEDLFRNILKKCISTVDTVLSKIPSLTKKDIDEIILVGGSTQIPKLQQMLVEYFDGKKLSTTIHPDEAVAHGAAVLACLLTQGPGHLENLIKISDVIPTPLSPEDLGLEAELPKIVEKQTTVPCTLANHYESKKENNAPSISNHTYEPPSIEYIHRILAEHFWKKLKEDFTLRKPEELRGQPVGTEPVPNYALVLKQQLSHSRLEEFLRPIIRDIYESTQSEPFSLELYSKGVISRSQKETCMGKPSNADRNDYLYGIVFVRNAVDDCIDALDNIENRHILEKMVQRLSVKLK